MTGLGKVAGVSGSGTRTALLGKGYSAAGHAAQDSGMHGDSPRDERPTGREAACQDRHLCNLTLEITGVSQRKLTNVRLIDLLDGMPPRTRGITMESHGKFCFEQPKPWAQLSPDGALVLLDNAALRSAAQSDLYARMVVSILDAAAARVDHILRERRDGDGTFGDAIRGLTIMPPNGGNQRAEARRADEMQPRTTVEARAAWKGWKAATSQPHVWLVVDDDGDPQFSCGWPQGCHEHINDALSLGLDDAKHWHVREAVLMPLPPND